MLLFKSFGKFWQLYFLVNCNDYHYCPLYSQMFHADWMSMVVIFTLLKYSQRNGFFVECGGLDGEIRSNTLYFERERGWKGLVIEADPANFAEMKTKHRKAYTSPTCLSTTSYSEKVIILHFHVHFHSVAGCSSSLKLFNDYFCRI